MTTSLAVSRAIIIVICLVLVGLAVYPMLTAQKDESVHFETVMCVRAICIKDSKIGTTCEHIKPRLSQVIIMEDVDSVLRKIMIIPTEASCVDGTDHGLSFDNN